MTRTIFLVRRASTVWNDTRRYLGSTDIDLDAAGYAQAERLGAWASTADIDTIATSPALRAARTAAVVGARIGVEPHRDDRLRELDFGVAEGRTLAEVRATDPVAVARFQTDPVANPLPGGEDPVAAVARIRAAVADLVATRSARALVVTHNTLLRLFLCDALGIPLAEYRQRFPVAEHCAVTELTVSEGTFALCRFNAVAAGTSERSGASLPTASHELSSERER